MNVIATTTTQAPRKCVVAHDDYNMQINSELKRYTKYAVAADNYECSKIGKSILAKDGSAVDAAIATGLCNSVMNAQSMGLGGGHFMNIYIK